jgi:hypothetical protein
MKYLLLRNNKESGPHSLEELKNMGLKAYDLIWLEGKSAAWRYPSELDELKDFAPPVEEQPFDRFFRRPAAAVSEPADKPVEQPAGAAAKQPQPVSISVEQPVMTPVAQPVVVTPSGQPAGKRIIYVTMPAGKGTAPNREVNREINRESSREINRESTRQPAREPIRETYHEPIQETYHEPIRETYREPIQQTHREGFPESPSFSSRIPETAPIRKPSNPRFVRPLVVTAAVLVLLTAGIFIGLALNKTGKDSAQKPATQDRTIAVKPPSPTQNTTAQQQPPATSNTASNTRSNTTASDMTVIQPNNKLPAKTAVRTPKEKQQQAPVKDLPLQTPPSRDSGAGLVNNQDIHREAVHRADVSTEKPDNTEKEAVKTSIANQVSVGSNNYTVGTFGGINDLQVTVTNRSTYPLDLVVVEVQYIQANKKVYKTENLYFRGIAAGSALMLEAPKSSRGIKIQTRIINISSKELGLSYSGI